jgi:hypothetical protein
METVFLSQNLLKSDLIYSSDQNNTRKLREFPTNTTAMQGNDVLDQLVRLRNRIRHFKAEKTVILSLDSMIEQLKYQIVINGEAEQTLLAEAHNFLEIHDEKVPSILSESSNAAQTILSDFSLVSEIVKFTNCSSRGRDSSVLSILLVSKTFNRAVYEFIWSDVEIFVSCPAHIKKNPSNLNPVLYYSQILMAGDWLTMNTLHQKSRFVKKLTIGVWDWNPTLQCILEQFALCLTKVRILEVDCFIEGYSLEFANWVEELCFKTAVNLKKLCIRDNEFVLNLMRRPRFKRVLSCMTSLDGFRFRSRDTEDCDVYEHNGELEMLCFQNLPSQLVFIRWSVLVEGGMYASSKAISLSHISNFRLTHLELYAVIITRENIPAFRKTLRSLKHLYLFRVKLQTSAKELRSDSDHQNDLPLDTLESLEVHF